MIRYILISLEIWGIVLCIIAGICVYLTREHDIKGSKLIRRLLTVEILLCIDQITLLVLSGHIAGWSVVLCKSMTLLVFLLNNVLLALNAVFVAYSIKKRGGRTPKAGSTLIFSMCVINTVFSVVSMFTEFYFTQNENNSFRRGPYVFIYYTLIFLCLATMLSEVIVARKVLKGRPFTALIALVVIPGLGAAIECLGQKLYFIDITTSMSYIVLIALYESDFANVLVEKERAMRDEQIRIFNQQIQPHFIFNTLTAIRSMCDEDSEAKKGIDSFSSYLRGCVDMLTKTECVSVKKELTVVDSFLDIIRMRFRDKIKTVKNIDNIDFTVPPFSIQSIVENAYYHGIRKKEERSGTLWITVFSKNDDNIVEIRDDGVGFDTDKILCGGGEEGHIGLINTIKRVEAMCGGRVEIDSVINEGTTVRLIFPIRRQ